MAVVIEPATEAAPDDEVDAPHDVGPHARAGGRPTTATLVAAGFALWGVVIGLRPLHDNSFMTHLATGRLILRTGHIPRSDPYSFTANGRPWVVQSWLASLAYGVLDRLDGLGGIRLLDAALATAMALLVWRLTRPARTLLPRIAIAGLVCVGGVGLWVERPLLIGLVCLALLVALVEGDGDLRWLVPVMWVWVNTHGSFPLGIGLLVLLAVGRRLDGEHPGRELRALAWALVGTAVGAINPLGIKLLLFPATLARHSQSFAAVQEWKPPRFDNPWQLVFLLEVVLAVVVVLRSRKWRVVLPLVVFAGLAFTSARNIVVADVVLVPGLALGLRDLGSIAGDRRPRVGTAVLGAIAVLGLLCTVSALRGPDTQLAAYPEASVDWLAQHGLLDQRVVAPDYVGNYLEARYRGRVPVFIDDRVDMFPDRLVQDSVALAHAPQGRAEAILARYRAGVVLWPRAKPLAAVLRASAHWHVVHQDARWVIFRPSDHPS